MLDLWSNWTDFAWAKDGAVPSTRVCLVWRVWQASTCTSTTCPSRSVRATSTGRPVTTDSWHWSTARAPHCKQSPPPACSSSPVLLPTIALRLHNCHHPPWLIFNLLQESDEEETPLEAPRLLSDQPKKKLIFWEKILVEEIRHHWPYWQWLRWISTKPRILLTYLLHSKVYIFSDLNLIYSSSHKSPIFCFAELLRFGICWSWRFQNTPYMSNLAEIFEVIDTWCHSFIFLVIDLLEMKIT